MKKIERKPAMMRVETDNTDWFYHKATLNGKVMKAGNYDLYFPSGEILHNEVTVEHEIDRRGGGHGDPAMQYTRAFTEIEVHGLTIKIDLAEFNIKIPV